MKFIVSSGEYFGKKPSMRAVEADSLRQCLVELIAVDEEDQHEFDHMTEEELVTAFNAVNGDGQPYIMIFCVDTNTQVI